ncbi:MAG TPA: prepilin-type N-terminal cleavage/methylation domain-containing protein [Phycisphaerae bacterium]|nr:prepilin-type N-terminal cleavage/methylation domain-containing protein [Phycisphaerae bacterium]
MTQHCRRPTARRAFTMVEAMAAVAIVAVLLVVALNTVGLSNANQYRTAQRATADALAQSLLQDILQLSYEDPATVPLFGPEILNNETSLSKTNYNDVDDFNGWSESPPQDRTGTTMSELTGWTRSVRVDFVSPTNPNSLSATDAGLKRITVTVSKNNVLLATRVALKGRHL